MQTIIFKKKEFEQVASLFLTESVIAIPTDTVMGLGVIARSEAAYQEMIKVKNRPQNKAFPLVVPNIDMLSSYGHINAQQRKVVEAFLPGPLTIVVNKQDNVQPYVTAGQDTIALRVIDDDFVQALLETLKEPILLTSANLAGEPSCVTSEEVQKVFFEKIRGIVLGEAKSGQASTIVDLTGDQPKIIREGAISLAQIMKVWEE